MRDNKYDNSRPLDVHKWSDYSEVNAAINALADEIIPALPLKKVDKNKYKKHLKVIVLDLLSAHLSNPSLYIGYSRSTASYSGSSRYKQLHINYRPLIKVIDALIELDYIDHKKGFHDSRTGIGKQSRMKANPKLIALLRDKHKVSSKMIARSEDEEVIILRDKDKNNIEYEDTPDTDAIRQKLRLINQAIDKAHINLHVTDEDQNTINERLSKEKGKQPIDFTRKKLSRVFNNGSFEQGGRFYRGWWQQVPKEYRKHIEINHKNTVEVDYSGMHIRMLYAEKGLDMPTDDPYELSGYPESTRGLLKKALNTIINANSRDSALRSLRKEIPKETLPDGVTLNNLVDAFTSKHAAISDSFYSGKGVNLQYIDSQVAEEVMLHFAKRGIAVLPMHDSFIVRNSYEGELREVMDSGYIKIVGTKPEMKMKKTALEEDDERRKINNTQDSVVDAYDIFEDMKKYNQYYEREDK
ncbi:hypothetical protein ACFL3K_01280 [Pseudomonadota bacterium]